MGARVWHLARGEDAREIETERVEKSIGHEETFEDDIDDDAVLGAELRRLADRVGARLRAHGAEAATVSIKVRFADFRTVSRSVTLPEPTAVGQRIGDAARELFRALERPLPVRLIGVRAENLRGTAQLETLWDDDAEWRRVEEAMDDASTRFGRGVVTRAALLGPPRAGSSLPSHPRPPRAGTD
jgi:DNA polymerase-4